MSGTDLSTYLNSMYQEAQLTTLLKSLETISSEGDAYSQSIASNALLLYKALDGFTAGDGTAVASKPRKVKAKAKSKGRAKAKRTTAKAKRTTAKAKRTTAKVKRTTAKSKVSDKTVEVVSAPTNGTAPSGNEDSSQRMKDFRERESLSQKKAAARAKVSISSWQAWENGKWVPGEGMMRRLAKIGV